MAAKKYEFADANDLSYFFHPRFADHQAGQTMTMHILFFCHGEKNYLWLGSNGQRLIYGYRYFL